MSNDRTRCNCRPSDSEEEYPEWCHKHSKPAVIKFDNGPILTQSIEWFHISFALPPDEDVLIKNENGEIRTAYYFAVNIGCDDECHRWNGYLDDIYGMSEYCYWAYINRLGEKS